jgi:hypothetical protein
MLPVIFSTGMTWRKTIAAPIQGSKLGTVDTNETGDGGRVGGRDAGNGDNLDSID